MAKIPLRPATPVIIGKPSVPSFGGPTGRGGVTSSPSPWAGSSFDSDSFGPFLATRQFEPFGKQVLDHRKGLLLSGEFF